MGGRVAGPRSRWTTRSAGLVTGVFGDLEPEGRPAVRITLTVRYVPFFNKTSSRTLPEPTSDHDAVLREVLALAARRRRTDAGPRRR